ncbi:MAG: UPF0149 family protein [Methylococcales symbiont of Hymedesmia sp. n. MRB-2018]|nr:MAG: UPF0149 family protein [Methylococcales symbiont of Hymedesmia sp. n. MRB-2018]
MAYLTITKIFQKNDSGLSAAEAHGLATGMLCINNKIEEAIWLAELFEQNVTLLDDDKTVLIALFEQTRKLLNAEENMYRYDLFLPADDEPLQYQLEAISSWCEGFLFGIGHSQSSVEWPREIKGILNDIVEFTKLDTDVDDEMDEEEKDEHETALIEIQEYLRAAVNIVKDELSEVIFKK